MNPAEIKLEDFERTVQRGCNKHMITKSRPIKINKNTLRSKIKILTSKQCSLLINGKLHCCPIFRLTLKDAEILHML